MLQRKRKFPSAATAVIASFGGNKRPLNRNWQCALEERTRRYAVEPSVADGTGNVHTSTMTLKGAALLALIGTVLITAFLVWTFVSNVLNVVRGVQAPVVLFSSFIYAFACLSVAVFFFVFHRAQP
jgi:hypothetical protein